MWDTSQTANLLCTYLLWSPLCFVHLKWCIFNNFPRMGGAGIWLWCTNFISLCCFWKLCFNVFQGGEKKLLWSICCRSQIITCFLFAVTLENEIHRKQVNYVFPNVYSSVGNRKSMCTQKRHINFFCLLFFSPQIASLLIQFARAVSQHCS